MTINSSHALNGNVVFLLGCTPRSSTTATMKALSAHSRLHAPSMADLIMHDAPKLMRRGVKWMAPAVQPLFDSRWNPAIHATGLDKPEAFDLAVMRQFKDEGVMGFTYSGLLQGKAAPTFTTQHTDLLEKVVAQVKKEAPGKIPLVKYFGGVFVIDEIRARFPGAKFIFLQRHPEKAFTSYVTLLANALKNEKLPTDYWQGVYRMVVGAYAQASKVQAFTDVLSLRSEEVSEDITKHVQIMLEYIGIPFEGESELKAVLASLGKKWQERSQKGMGYTYIEEITKGLYKADDFKIS